MGSAVCRSLWKFVFQYSDVSSGAHNHAAHLTEGAVLRLTENCPNLRCVQLQGTKGLTDNALICFFRRCADLTDLEISATSGGGSSLTGTSFDTLRENPDWAPKLIKLRVNEDKSKLFMKAMRELTRAREQLLVQLVWVSEHKVYRDDDYVLENTEWNYLEGRIQNNMKYIKRKKDGYRYEKPVWDPKRYEAYQKYQYNRMKHWHDAHTWSQSRFWSEIRIAGL